MAKKQKGSSTSSGTEIFVKTAQITNAASGIDGLNKKMDTDFNDVIKKINGLQGAWNGKASSKAISSFNKIKSAYYTNSSSSRKSVLNNYVKFLKNAVASDYEHTESANTSLADLFK